MIAETVGTQFNLEEGQEVPLNFYVNLKDVKYYGITLKCFVDLVILWGIIVDASGTHS